DPIRVTFPRYSASGERSRRIGSVGFYPALRDLGARIALWVLMMRWWRCWRISSRSTGRIRMSGAGGCTRGPEARAHAALRDCGLAAAAAVIARAAGVSRATVI